MATTTLADLSLDDVASQLLDRTHGRVAQAEVYAYDTTSTPVDFEANRLKSLETKDSRIIVRDTDRSLTFADVTRALGNVMIIGKGLRGPNPGDVSIATFGAQFAEVEVDVETGIVRVLRLVAAHDAGRIVNPTLAESQLEGGIIQGLGYAVFEERVLDGARGVTLNPNLHDYRIPAMLDVPAIDAFFVGEADTRANHTGARGIAEPPIIPTAPAIAAAVADAIGAFVTQIPLTPWRVLGAMAER